MTNKKTSGDQIIKSLVDQGSDKGFLTTSEFNKIITEELTDPDKINSVLEQLNTLSIKLVDDNTDEETLAQISKSSKQQKQNAQQLVEQDYGHGTADPVRLYMRDMGAKDLLSRADEIRIAKNIEEGIHHIMLALAEDNATIKSILKSYQDALAGEARLTDLVSGLVGGNESAAASNTAPLTPNTESPSPPPAATAAGSSEPGSGRARPAGSLLRRPAMRRQRLSGRGGRRP